MVLVIISVVGVLLGITTGGIFLNAVKAPLWGAIAVGWLTAVNYFGIGVTLETLRKKKKEEEVEG